VTTRILHTCCAIVLTVVLSGCAVYTPVADFTKQRYTNVVSYFNTFYNAQRQFNDAEDEVIKARRDFLERAVVNKQFVIPSSARQKFQTSIEKNSKVLSFYADSKWVDDALLMIGKAYFYMDDDVRAERKFLELAAQFPNSSVIPESQLWLGKSYLRQKKTDQGIKQLEEVFAKTMQSDGALAGEAAYELAQHYYRLKDYPLAEKHYLLASELVSDGETLTQIYFQLGKCYTELRQHEKAMVSYGSAADVSPVYTWIFQAQLQQIKTKAFQEQYEEALESLQDMLRDSKNTEFFSIIHFEIANILSMQGKFDAAEEKYRYVDTAFAKTDEAARSYFTLGTMYEERMRNYDSARVFYNRAKTEFPASEITPVATRKAEVFNKYSDLRKDLSKYDSLYIYELTKPEPVDSTLLKKDSVAVNDSVSTAEVPKIKMMAKPVKNNAKKDSVLTVDSVKIKEQLHKEKIQEALLDSLQHSIARTKFELGGLFFLEIQIADSAVRWFDDVIMKYPKSQFAPRALYTKAEIFRTMQNRPQEELDQIYRDIIDQYGESPYANEARRILGIPLVIEQQDTALADFEQAEILTEKKEYLSAIAQYKRIAGQFPNSPVAAQALYAAGWQYEHSLVNNDSAYALYKRLALQYPASKYTTAVRAKIAEVEAERVRIEDEQKKAAEDLKRAEEEKKKAAEAAKEKKTVNEAPAEPAPSDSLLTPKNKL
jgi:TolA-binding protein